MRRTSDGGDSSGAAQGSHEDAHRCRGQYEPLRYQREISMTYSISRREGAHIYLMSTFGTEEKGTQPHDATGDDRFA